MSTTLQEIEAKQKELDILKKEAKKKEYNEKAYTRALKESRDGINLTLKRSKDLEKMFNSLKAIHDKTDYQFDKPQIKLNQKTEAISYRLSWYDYDGERHLSSHKTNEYTLNTHISVGNVNIRYDSFRDGFELPWNVYKSYRALKSAKTIYDKIYYYLCNQNRNEKAKNEYDSLKDQLISQLKDMHYDESHYEFQEETKSWGTQTLLHLKWDNGSFIVLNAGSWALKQALNDNNAIDFDSLPIIKRGNKNLNEMKFFDCVNVLNNIDKLW